MRSRLPTGALAGTVFLGLALAGLLLVAAPASGQDIGARKQIIDGRIDVLQKKIEAARQREGVLTSEIEVVTDKIHALQDDVDSASARLNQLEAVLALHQRKLDRLNQLYEVQTRKLVFLQRQHKAATKRLNKRIVEIYTTEHDIDAQRRARVVQLLRAARSAGLPERDRTSGRKGHERGQAGEGTDAGDPERDPEDPQAGRRDHP